MHKIHSTFINDILHCAPKEIKKLKGDASERMYFRVTTAKKETFILMQDTDNPAKNSIKNYITLTEILLNSNVCVPHIYGKDVANNLLLLEDGGDISLFEATFKKDEQIILSLYKKTIDEMIKIHETPVDAGDKPCFTLAFDTEKLMWELDFFLTHAKECGVFFSDADMTFLRAEFMEICDTISSTERVLTHRDYHSRNVMIKKNKPFVIDFQDARMGTPAYDLCSLLKDSYINLEKHLVDKLLDYYFAETNITAEQQQKFLEIFQLMTFQRSIKACGSFYYLNCKKNKKDYMKYIPVALEYAKEALAHFPKYAELSNRFFPLF